MIDIPTDEIVEEFKPKSAEELRAQAMKVLYDNQECYVAQWILQNPFANPADYTLKFVYHDQSRLGYDVQMVRIEE